MAVFGWVDQVGEMGDSQWFIGVHYMNNLWHLHNVESAKKGFLRINIFAMIVRPVLTKLTILDTKIIIRVAKTKTVNHIRQGVNAHYSN